jgi:D-alanyl-lipoteichoic acid acyltransferase DltB (MBOAT superfamily)
MREHVAESNEPTVRSVLAEWRTRTTWGWLLTVLVPFVVVLVSGISFGLEVLFIAAVAVMFAAFAAQDDREALTSSAAEFGLAVERSPVTISWVTTTFLSTLGWVGIAAFLAGVVAVAIR